MIPTRMTEGQERPRLRVPIPLVPEELRPAVQSVLRAVAGFRAAFARVGDGMDFEQIVTEHHAFLGRAAPRAGWRLLVRLRAG
jgi:hypothetical protein